MDIETLIPGEGTLYDLSPQKIAKLVQDKFKELDSRRLEIVSVGAIPDFHVYLMTDGGNKNIFFLTRPIRNYSPKLWQTELLNGQGTMCGANTASIYRTLQTRIDQLEDNEFRVRHAIYLTDQHSASWITQGMLYIPVDGLKDIILCYHKKRNRH